MKKSGLMDRILVFIAALLITFTVGMIVLYIKTGGIPDTLVTCVFGVCGGECGVMGWIKTTKEKQRERAERMEDAARARTDAGSEQLRGDGTAAPSDKQLHGDGAAAGQLSAAQEQDRFEAQEGLEEAG